MKKLNIHKFLAALLPVIFAVITIFFTYETIELFLSIALFLFILEIYLWNKFTGSKNNQLGRNIL